MTEERATYRVGNAGAKDIRETALLPFADPGYTKPTPDEIRAALSMAGLSGNGAAQLLGLSSGRKVRAWTSGESDMPYSAWRLLLQAAGLVSGEPPPVDPSAESRYVDLADAMILWEEASPEAPRGRVRVLEHLVEKDDASYSKSAGRCGDAWPAMTPRQRAAYVLALFVDMTERDGVDPKTAAVGLSRIREWPAIRDPSTYAPTEDRDPLEARLAVWIERGEDAGRGRGA